MNEISPSVISAAAGALISIILSIMPLFPRYKNKWISMEDDQKQAVNVVSMMVTTLMIALLSCTTELKFIPCTQIGLFELGGMFVMAALGNAVTYVTVGKSVKRYI